MLPLLLPLLLLSRSLSSGEPTVGVNWGTAASHPLPPAQVVALMKANKISKVKLFDADPLVLSALSGSSIGVTVGIPNSMLRSLNSSLKAARSWVHDNLTRFDRVLIEYIAVGDEPFLLSYGEQYHPFIVGAAVNIQTALQKANLAEKVKVVVPCSFDAFQSESGRPSKGHFRPDVNRTMIELLSFLYKYRSPFFVTVSPFHDYHENKNISLDFALFRKSARPHNDSRKTYKNSFDLSYSTLLVALSNAGFPKRDIVIGKIGWPTDGAANASSSLAEEFMKGLMDHLHSKSENSMTSEDLPREIYVFSLLDEDQRSIVSGNFDRHWGVFTFDGQAKYQVNFGQGSNKLVNVLDVQYLSSKWCVVNNNKDLSNATSRALEACSTADCSALSAGGSCFNLSWPANISYAFNSYYQQHDQQAESCDFGGLGLITTVDPSVAACRFSIELKTSCSVSVHRPISFRWAILIFPVMTIFLCSLSER